MCVGVCVGGGGAAGWYAEVACVWFLVCHLHSPGNGHICLSVLSQLFCISQVSGCMPVSTHTYVCVCVCICMCMCMCVSKGWGGIVGSGIGKVKVKGNLHIISKIGLVSQK